MAGLNRGRPKKVEEVVTVGQDDQVAALTKQVEMLMQQLQAMKAPQSAPEAVVEKVKPEVVYNDKINQDDYIPVMSLIHYPLNLSTQKFGMGDTKKFTKFGEIKQILYSDLVRIMKVHSNFLNDGLFYIMHPGLIRKHGLDEAYSKILTKEMLEEIFVVNSKDALELYTSAGEKQQEVIVNMVVDKLIADPDAIDLNTVDRLARASRVDIIGKVEDARAIEKERLEANKEN